MDYDFGGYATRNNIECTDGRVICKDAFKDQDHTKVPMVYMHDHVAISNVLGHCLLENREDGMYVYGKFNDTPEGLHAKESVKNGDVQALSIYANRLKQNGRNVVHGAIREVSLVLAGANPGAYIDTIMIHSDDDTEEAEICFVGENTRLETEFGHSDENSQEATEVVEHADEPAMKEDSMPSSANTDSRTIQDVIDTMDEDQKNVLYALVGLVAERALTKKMTIPMRRILT